jgi:formylglycine-generating enzyme required for sulfatase activity
MSESGGASGAGGESGATSEVVPEVGTPLVSPSCATPHPACTTVDPCRTLHVAGGSFEMGRSEIEGVADYYPAGLKNEVPAHAVTVSPYWLDEYEVTVARFRRFVESYDGTPLAEDAGAHPNVPGSGWQREWNGKLPKDQAALRAIIEDPSLDGPLQSWTPDPGAHECLPMNAVPWYVAFAFCVWDAGRLPTEAEWEFAAAGGAAERLYPWGAAAPSLRRAVYGCMAHGSADCGAGDLLPVGSTRPLGDGLFGHADLAGSVSEWVRDTYAGAYGEPIASGVDIVMIATDLVDDTALVRSGYYGSGGSALRSAARGSAQRSTPDLSIGLRCARDL